MKSGKVWGMTEDIISNAYLEVHRIEVKPHMCCSWHVHYTKVNGFYVESGAITIVMESGDLLDETALLRGDYMEVPSGRCHRFETGKQPCVVYEIYYPDFRHDDITREDVGGSTK